jgi:hypothetical protein
MVYGVGKRVISGSILLILGVFARSAYREERANILRSCNLEMLLDRQEAWIKEAVAANEVCLSLT